MKRLFKKRNEQGRTMLETLAVLAIMGLITFGGVQAYRAAMDAYKAGATLDQAMQLAMQVASQKRIGQSGSLSDSDARKGPYVFALSDGVEPRTFVLTALDVPASVQKRLAETPSSTAVVDISGNNVNFTFNNNLGPISLNDNGSNADLGNGSNSGSDSDSDEELDPSVIDTGECPNGNVWLSYYTGHECDTETPHKGDEGMECVTNSDCEEGEYCKLVGGWDSRNICTVVTGSTCESIGNFEVSNGSIPGIGQVIKSVDEMQWWAADNWCKALGKRLISLDDLRCYHSGTNNPVATSDFRAPIACCKGNSAECVEESVDGWKGHWNGKVLKEADADFVRSSYSPVLIALTESFGHFEGWTETGSRDCIGAFQAETLGGYAQGDLALMNNDFALCK